MIDTNAINAECIHAVKLALEGLLAAGLLTFCWHVAPAIRGGGRRG